LPIRTNDHGRSWNPGRKFLVAGVWCVLAIHLASGGTERPEISVGTIQDGGQFREFVLALDEIHLRSAESRQLRAGPFNRVEELFATLAAWPASPGTEPCAVLYEQGTARSESSRRLLTRTLLIQVTAGFDPARLDQQPGVRRSRPVEGQPHGYLLDVNQPGEVLPLAAALRQLPGVVSAEPLLARRHMAKRIPNDPLLGQQWHLLNTGQWGGLPGIDLHVTDVWDNWRGEGVVIGMVDEGVQSSHPDLIAHFKPELSTNFNTTAFNPAVDTHGTPVAGLAAAAGDNGLGLAGVAYEAGWADLRLLGDYDTDEQDQAAVLHALDRIQVKNNSWGASDGYGSLEGPGPLMSAGLVASTTHGRQGLGTVHVFSAGNGRTYGEDANYDGFANSIYVIAVGAVNDLGQPTSYSEPGACLAVVAPSRGSAACSGRPGLTSTDLTGNQGRNPGASCDLADRDYTQVFGGTSGAAPLVSGTVALLLEANPRLGWRDVKEILLRSATPLAPEDQDWHTNRAGIMHHHQFGAGLVNVAAAVSLAAHWRNLQPMEALSLGFTNQNIAIPDNSPTGWTQTFTITNQGFRVEQAAVTLTLPHQRHGDLAIQLTSPWGTTSRLAAKHNSYESGYADWTLTSVRHWGEPAAGDWTVQISDLVPLNTGTLQSLRLVLYGSYPVATLGARISDQRVLLTLSASAPGWSFALEASATGGSWSPIALLRPGVEGRASYSAPLAPEAARFFRARHLP